MNNSVNYTCDSPCYSFTAKNQSVPVVTMRDPMVYKYKCISNGPNFNLCANTVGYGMSDIPTYRRIKPSKVPQIEGFTYIPVGPSNRLIRSPGQIEDFDFSMSVNDYTPK